ncbi:SGNH/GDSL hydrolase family protein [Sutcliffiella horikoshii]|uniref:SGNH/GDSL hydrolase family protein n=1 Tax=Sutcliffiella horikoshii TaxID=79883 RepID=UPI001CFCFBA4|nr:SGNH/GDSL hydrolase family protein [Sutcliffiella horikoshii]
MRALMTLVLLLCIGTIVYGNYHWNSKLGAAVEGKVEAVHKNSTATATEVVDKEESNQSDFRNLPISLVEKLQEKIKNGEVVNLAIIGSEVNALNDDSWSTIFIEEMERTYDGLFNITVTAVQGEVTTRDVVQGNLHLENLKTKPDVVILEPFLLESNGLILIEHSLQNISAIIEDLKAQNPDVFLFLQPAQPIYNAIYYPDDVEALKSWTEENGYTYIDHWTSWPGYQTDELKEYIKPESITPNEKGHEKWAEFMVNYFTGKE